MSAGVAKDDASSKAPKSKGRGCLYVFLAGIGIFLAMYFLVWAPTYSWKQKLTVTVATPEGEVSGSSVIKAWFTSQPFDSAATRRWRGEAPVTDLGGGKYVFALNRAPVDRTMAYFGDQADHCKGKWSCIYRSFKGWPLRGWFTDAPVQVLTPQYYPLLVTFGDIGDPASVKRVDPFDMDAAFGLCPDGSGLKDEDAPWRAEGMMSRRWAQWQASGLTLEEFEEDYPGHIVATDAVKRRFMTSVPLRDTSGDCYQLKSITLAITSDPVTSGKVEQVLGWLSKHNDWMRVQDSSGIKPELISPSDFNSEVFK